LCATFWGASACRGPPKGCAQAFGGPLHAEAPQKVVRKGAKRARKCPEMKQRKTAHLQKDSNRRQQVLHFEHKRQTLKTILHNLHLKATTRSGVLFSKQGPASPVSAKSSRVRVRNRCVLTGRSRGVHKFFKISRIMIRDSAAKGLSPGVKKAS